MTTTLVLLAFAAIAAAVLLAWKRHRIGIRAQALTQVLDAADALESRLRTARAEIEAIVGHDDNPVRDAMQEMLRQRLWLRQHGDSASLQQLRSVQAAIDAGSKRIDQQLLQIERARAALH